MRTISDKLQVVDNTECLLPFYLTNNFGVKKGLGHLTILPRPEQNIKLEITQLQSSNNKLQTSTCNTMTVNLNTVLTFDDIKVHIKIPDKRLVTKRYTQGNNQTKYEKRESISDTYM